MLRRTLLTLLLLASAPLHAGERVSAEAANRPVTLSGFTRPQASLPLIAESDGKVLAVAVDIGDAIPEDGTFARIDPTFIQLDREANRVSQAQLRSRIAFDEKEVERHRELIRKGSTSRATLDELEQTLRDNRLQLDALVVAGKVLDERLSRTRVSAPAGWRVTARTVEPGQVVDSGQQLGTVADLRSLSVPFALGTSELQALEAQAAPRLRLPDLGLEVPVALTKVNPDFDPTTRKRTVELRLLERPPGALGGLRAELVLALAERSGAVFLPQHTIVRDHEEYWVTRADGKRFSVVRLGVEQRDGVEWWRVTAPGLAPGQQFELKE